MVIVCTCKNLLSNKKASRESKIVEKVRKFFFGRKSSSKLILKTKWYHSCGYCDNLQNCEQLKKRVTDILKKKLGFEP